MARDGICAIATAPGEGGIAIVRMSGAGAREILSACFRPARAREILSHRMMYGYAVDARGVALDEVMAVFFAAPNTYTREDMFEIQCHGGGICARRVLERVIALGARIAEPGEFTRRAFLNGRIDLSRAEAVMALIGAKSEAAARASLRQLEGGISGFVRGVGEEIKEMMALVEACTDFPDEVDEPDAARRVRAGAEKARREIAEKCDERGARILREGASIVLAGRPNVGKSSLMNALLQQERAIVTEIPGTTRDVLTERIEIGGVMAEISDTAGQRETGDLVERIGVERAERAMEGADVVLIVLDASQMRTPEDEALLARMDGRCIVCLNKCDLPRRSDYPGAIELSAATGAGVDALVAALSDRLRAAGGMEERMTQERHLRLARRAMEALDRAVEAIDGENPLDVVEIDLREALGALCEITGEDASEEVIDRVFQSFCVGK